MICATSGVESMRLRLNVVVVKKSSMYQILHIVLFVIDGFFGLDEGSRFFLWIICRRKAGQDAPPTGEGGA